MVDPDTPTGAIGANEIDLLIERRHDGRSGREQANREAERQKENDLRRLAAVRSENAVLWAQHLRRTASTHLALARSARSRARRLENGEG